jgi:endoglucanase
MPALLSLALVASLGCGDATSWPHWREYVAAFVQGDGRVVDRTAQARSTSEGQAYALFLSLVANDRGTFDRVLSWTEANLAGGDLGRRLPAWLWGKDPQGRWRTLDENAASDADLWTAYALLEAGRLWSEPRYDRLARALLAQIASREVADVPGLGPTLLPAPSGFVLEGGKAWRLNPSYLPPQLLRRLAAVPGPWRGVLASAERVVRATALHGVVADWVLYRDGAGFVPDPGKGPLGSYDAIRTYLWIGMLPRGDPLRASLASATGGLLRLLEERGEVPEQVDQRSLRGNGRAPVGFYAALLPLALARGDGGEVRELERRIDAARTDGLYGSPPTYYDQNLVLFGRGFADGRWRFERDGRVTPAWEEACQARGR